MIYLVIMFGGPLWYSTEISSSNPHFERYVKAFKEWEQRNPSGEMTKDGRYPRHPALSNLKPTSMKLVYRMLHLDPTKRITIQEALNDKWVQSIEICNVDGGAGCGTNEIDAGCKNVSRQVVKCGVNRLHQHLPSSSLSKVPFGKDYD